MRFYLFLCSDSSNVAQNRNGLKQLEWRRAPGRLFGHQFHQVYGKIVRQCVVLPGEDSRIKETVEEPQ